MPFIKASVEIPVETSVVYRYLRGRYQSENFKSATMATKGFSPEVGILDDVEDEYLEFRAAGRDTLLNLPISSWTWSYDLRPTKAGATKVTLEYRWSVVLSVLSAWTVKHQAANELTETVMALDALSFHRQSQ